MNKTKCLIPLSQYLIFLHNANIHCFASQFFCNIKSMFQKLRPNLLMSMRRDYT